MPHPPGLVETGPPRLEQLGPAPLGHADRCRDRSSGRCGPPASPPRSIRPPVPDSASIAFLITAASAHSSSTGSPSSCARPGSRSARSSPGSPRGEPRAEVAHHSRSQEGNPTHRLLAPAARCAPNPYWSPARCVPHRPECSAPRPPGYPIFPPVGSHPVRLMRLVPSCWGRLPRHGDPQPVFAPGATCALDPPAISGHHRITWPSSAAILANAARGSRCRSGGTPRPGFTNGGFSCPGAATTPADVPCRRDLGGALWRRDVTLKCPHYDRMPSERDLAGEVEPASVGRSGR